MVSEKAVVLFIANLIIINLCSHSCLVQFESLAQLLPELYSTRSNYFYLSGDFDGAINIQVKIHMATISEAGIPLKSQTKKVTIRYLLFSNSVE